MPVEIKELIIRANIIDKNEKYFGFRDDKKNVELNQEIIQACVEQVLKILESKEDR